MIKQKYFFDIEVSFKAKPASFKAKPVYLKAIR